MDIEIIDTHCHVEPWFMDLKTEKVDKDAFKNIYKGCRHKTRLCVASTGGNPALVKMGNVAAVHRLAKLLGPFPEKFILQSMVNPHDKEGALQAIEIGVKKYGFKMVGELVQYIHHWQTDGREILPVIQKAIDLDVPLMFHSGDVFHCEGVAHIAYKFPRARIIIAHCAAGRDWYRGIVTVKEYSNVSIEIMSGNAEQIKALIELVGPNRITFGTDFCVDLDPARRYTPGNGLLDCLEKMKLSDKVIASICSGNAKNILKLED